MTTSSEPGARRCEFSVVGLATALANFPRTKRYVIAFSGGADSLALAHAMIRLSPRFDGVALLALHVDHQLQPEAGEWVAHCQEVCRQLSLSLQVSQVSVASPVGRSLEEQARIARYQALREALEPGDVVLTAHHRDDQAETVMLRLLRGSGPRGLAAMPSLARFGLGWLARPLLGVSGASLRQYSHSTGLRWVEDASNLDTRHDRNFLRHEIFPTLRKRWPGMARTFARAARHLAASEEVLAEIAAEDLERVRRSGENLLDCDRLSEMSDQRARMVIRAWLEASGFALPSAKHCHQILAEVVGSRPDRVPLVAWGGVEVRRFRGALYARKRPRYDDRNWALRWRPPAALQLPHGRLQVESSTQMGLRKASLEHATVVVRLRRGGERIKLNDCHRSLKNLFQESGVPPWERDTLPLVFADEVLIAVADRWTHADYRPGAGEPGWRVCWHPDR